MRNFLFILILAFCLPAPAKDAACEPRLADAWRATQGHIESGTFTQERDLAWYGRDFAGQGMPKLENLLKELRRNSVWMDLGAGRARALREALGQREFQHIARLVATSFDRFPDASLREDLHTHRGRFEHLVTGFLDQALADKEHGIHQWMNGVDFLTDDYGPSSYAFDMQEMFDFYSDVLKDRGRALVLFDGRTRVNRPGEESYGSSMCGVKEFVPAFSLGKLRVLSSGRNEQGHCVMLLERVPRTSARAPEGEALKLEVKNFVAGRPPSREYRLVPRARSGGGG